MPAWKPDTTRILTRGEIRTVLEDLRRRRRSVNTRQNRAIFRLAVGCGLRASEIAGLKLSNVRAGQTTPVLHIPKAIAKGGRARTFPIVDPGTAVDLQSWKEERIEQGAEPSDLFVCTQSTQSFGQPLHRTSIRNRFRNACKVLGPERLERLTVHDGRHTFASYAVEMKGLAWTRDALGHSSIGTTSLYSHATESAKPVDLFRLGPRS